MAEKQSPVRKLLSHLWPHAVWDGIHTLIALGGATVIASVVALLQRARHHWDILAILAVFIVSVVMLAIAAALIEKKNRAAKPLPTEGHPVPMPTFRTIEEWDEARNNLNAITNRKFTHEEVTLDGNQFVGCSFVHVNLFYNGTAPVSFDNCDFDEDTVKHFHSRNPAMAQWIELLRNLGMLRQGLNFALTPVEPVQWTPSY